MRPELGHRRDCIIIWQSTGRALTTESDKFSHKIHLYQSFQWMSRGRRHLLSWYGTTRVKYKSSQLHRPSEYEFGKVDESMNVITRYATEITSTSQAKRKISRICCLMLPCNTTLSVDYYCKLTIGLLFVIRYRQTHHRRLTWMWFEQCPTVILRKNNVIFPVHSFKFMTPRTKNHRFCFVLCKLSIPICFVIIVALQ